MACIRNHQYLCRQIIIYGVHAYWFGKISLPLLLHVILLVFKAKHCCRDNYISWEMSSTSNIFDGDMSITIIYNLTGHCSNKSVPQSSHLRKKEVFLKKNNISQTKQTSAAKQHIPLLACDWRGSRQSLCVVNDQPVGNPKRKVWCV
jgi:hypothetical protein